MDSPSDTTEGHTVFLADPDPITAATLSLRLQELGYAVVGAAAKSDGALAAAAAFRPDVVIISADLPGPGSPRETALGIRDGLGIPVLVTAAHPVDTLSPDGEEGLSPQEILVGLFGPDDLTAAIEAVIARHRARHPCREWVEAFRQAAEIVPGFIMLLGTDRHIRFVNLSGAAMAGRPRDALIGLDAVGTALPLSDRDGGDLRRRFDEEQEFHVAADCIPIGRCRFSLRWTCQPVRDGRGCCAGWVCSGTGEGDGASPDASLQAEILLRFEKNMEQLAILNDRIRNPLQVIAAFAEFANDNIRDKILLQVEAINETVRQLDQGWLESATIREYLRKHHRMAL